ncbi:MAG: iron-sulfur cluster assembly accessory protein, partial [Symploca sp. SIO3E6]|nr:iron-sulfur cluster assembly accessory protein [Caldora sp. SIO3E6]
MINLSQAAVSEIRRLQVRLNNQAARLRLGVQAGGCAQLYYTIDFDDEINPGDHIYDREGISVIVDTPSL